MIFHFTDVVDVGVGQVRALVMGLVVAGLLSLLAFLHHHYPCELSSAAWASLPDAAASKEWAQLSCSWILISGSLTLTSPGSTLLLCPGKVQGPLS